MSISIDEIISRAEQLAVGIGIDPYDSAVIDSELTAETLVPHVFLRVTQAYAGDPSRHHLLRQKKTLTLANGKATLPAGVLTQAMATAELDDTADQNVRISASWKRYLSDFVSDRRRLTPLFALGESGQFYYTRAGEQYDPNSGFTGSLDLYIPCIPQLPAASSTSIDIAEEVVNDIIAALAGALRGEAPWQQIIAGAIG